jgi:NADP-dependent aldehyde dehydrogenase
MEDLDSLFEEAFGAAAVVVEYDDPAELVEIASQLPGQLTATVQAEEDDGIAPALLDVLSDHAGRILWNGWPTGVSVTWAMQHGGPWPATTASLHTSVGPTALRRFLQPVAFQNLPAAMLPAAVRDDNPLRIWQRVDGKLTSPEEVG